MSKYVIMVGGSKPAKVIAAHPNKDGTPGPNAYETNVLGGRYYLINRCRVWARRVLPDGKLPKSENQEVPLEMTDSRYRGDLQFLKYGSTETGAHQIEIRYLPTSRSLDYQYQEVVQKIRVDSEGKDGSALIELDAGQNRFDAVKDALLVQMLKVHPQNRNSKSRNPDPMIKGHTFYELTDEDSDTANTDRVEKALDAGRLVKDISTDMGNITNLFDLMKSSGADFGDVDEKSLDKDIYAALLMYSQREPQRFQQVVDDFKKTISDCFAKAKGFKAIDFTKKGTIAVTVEGKPPQILFSGLEGKEEEMELHVLAHFYKKGVYEQVGTLKKICEDLK